MFKDHAGSEVISDFNNMSNYPARGEWFGTPVIFFERDFRDI